MRFELDQAMDVLRRTPGALTAMLEGLGACWVEGRYGEGTFHPFDVVGHLIHADQADWIPRVRWILEHGETAPFEPFDRYAMYEASRGKSMRRLLAEFASVREGRLAELAALNLSESQLDLYGQHPALGRVTMRQLLATWVAHDLNHIHQVAKAMAFQYEEAVGPWRGHLGVFPKADSN
ncbi:MAG TPA: DinB family protein [Phycisphaerae bacterium]|nr:DinB family protein [Phycisphaerae bacterium]HRW53765.1 DinB family protein [Phycisphaerae bacterium]